MFVQRILGTTSTTKVHTFRGIKTASAVFTRLMRLLLQGMNHAVHYIDDVLVATNNWEEHLATLRELFERIRSAGLTIKPQKCELGVTYVTFLGHRLGGGKIQPVESVVTKLIESPRPETKKQVRLIWDLLDITETSFHITPRRPSL